MKTFLEYSKYKCYLEKPITIFLLDPHSSICSLKKLKLLT